ncbi:MAG: transporter substrate-binding domain-containing protein [Vibrio sp.]
MRCQTQLRDAVARYQFQLRRKALRRRVIKSGINPQHKLKVKLESQPRYVIYHSTGQVSGMSADILNKVCDVLLLPCEITSHKEETWSNMFHDLQSDKIDILGPIVVSAQRKKLVYFSESYYHPQAYMIKRFGYKDDAYQDISQLVAERIGVIKDDFFQELLKQKLPNKTLIEFDSQKEMISGLLRHDVDYIVMNRINYSYALGQTPKMIPLTIDKVIGSIYQNDIAFGFPKTPKGQILANLFSDALHIIDTDKIVRQYDIQPGWRSIFVIRNSYQHRLKIMSGIVITMLIAFFLYIRWSAKTDSLTGVYGRRALFHRFRNGVPPRLCFARVDIGNMKEINQKYGIDVGDKVLKELAKHVRRQWRGKVYRLHSTSFICVGKHSTNEANPTFERIKGLVYIDSKRGVNIAYSVEIKASTVREKPMALYEVLKQMSPQ